MFSPKERRIAFAIFVALAILVVCGYLISRVYPPAASGVAPASSTKTPQRPPFTAEVKAALAASKGFQILVSYTDRGFEPAFATIKAGDAVRFTNNSSHDLWIAAAGGAGSAYPGDGNNCGQSAFDSCRVLKYGEFWEFTFATAGTWSYQNNRDTKMTGVVRAR
jgi:plastocyanin